MTTYRIDISDAAWLLMESRERPMHVATLLIYELPEGAKPDFVGNLVAQLQHSTEFADPFNRRLAHPLARPLLPQWEQDYDLDLEYHVRHLALPFPGGERELGVMISRLHSNPMDFNRPLWEYHVIEGLENNRFAVYFKMHHSIVDGIAGLRMLQRSMSTRPEDTDTPALWSAHAPEESTTTASQPVLGNLLKSVTTSVESVGQVTRKLFELAQATRDPKDPATLPFQAPKSILNHRIHSQRRFATQLYEFERIRRLAKATHTTINDVVLAVCGGALRRFLKEIGELPGRPLTAGVPVSLRTSDDQGAGSAVSFIYANLATNIADPVRRLEVIAASTRRAKSLMQGMPRDAVEKFSMTVLAPYSLQLMMGLDGRTRPVFNLVISNIPGPAEPLYFRGARLQAMYPVSQVTHGQALNITCYSYAGTLAFGFSGCRDTLPSMQRIAVYTGSMLEELEEAVYGSDKKSGPVEPSETKPRTQGSKKKASAKKLSAKKSSRIGKKTTKKKPRVRKKAVRKKKSPTADNPDNPSSGGTES